MAGKHRYWEFERYPKYKQAYINAFDKMLEVRRQKGLKEMRGWNDGKSVLDGGLTRNGIQTNGNKGLAI